MTTQRLAVLTALLFASAASPAVAGGRPASGAGSTREDSISAASAPAAGLAGAALARFEIGAAIFRAEWVAAPNVSDGADGLGPLYNATSCAACHGGREGARLALKLAVPAAAHPTAEDRPPGSATPSVLPHPVYGTQLQDRAVAGRSAEGRLEVRHERSAITLAEGTTVELVRPVASVAAPAYGPIGDKVMVSLRRPPPVAGIGLIAAIDAADILAGADPDDHDGDGISGRPGLVPAERAAKRLTTGSHADGSVGAPDGSADVPPPRLARFGWKASVATLEEQAAAAFSLDMGLSSPFVPGAAGDCTARQPDCLDAPNGDSASKGGYEVSGEEIALVTAFLEGLAPPPPRSDGNGADNGGAVRGAALFAAIGCAGCHRPSFLTPELPGKRHLSGRKVPLYSDLLLHDMGEGLGDGRPDGAASGREWRTAPLWGLWSRDPAAREGAGPGLLHDGRARSVTEAILWHGGEAAAAGARFAALPEGDRQAILAFLSRL